MFSQLRDAGLQVAHNGSLAIRKLRCAVSRPKGPQVLEDAQLFGGKALDGGERLRTLRVALHLAAGLGKRLFDLAPGCVVKREKVRFGCGQVA